MPPIQIETELRRVARDRISKGKLPRTVPRRMWGGQGAGRICALCDEGIKPAEMELELEQRIDGNLQSFRFHVVCHSLWQIECARTGSLNGRPKT
jgi:hypothetical protein